VGRGRRGWEECLQWDGWERKIRRIIRIETGEWEKKGCYVGSWREG
jgi:hypothetical protein